MWRRLILCAVVLGCGVASSAAGEPGRCLLKRTALDEGTLTSTLYVADPVAAELKSLATFEEFDIGAAAVDGSGETVLVVGYPYGVPRQVVRVYRVDIASGDYTPLGDFDYPQLPEVGVAYDEKEGVFYVAAWGDLDSSSGPEGFLMPATSIYHYDPISGQLTPFHDYKREYALVGAGAGALYATTSGFINRDLEWGKIFVYLDADSGDVNYTGFIAGEGLWNEGYAGDPAEDEGPWWDSIRDRSWFTCPARYPQEGIRQRPIYFYSYDLLRFIGEHIEVYVNGPADGDSYRKLEVDWRALDIFYSYRRDAAVYLLRGDNGSPTEIIVIYGDGTPGPPFELPAYEPIEAVKIAERYELSFDYSLLYVE